MADHLRGKVVVITGAGSGFGRLVAQKTAARGARVVLADVAEAGLRETVGSIAKEGGECAQQLADVCDREQMMRLAQLALDRYGAIDVWINNAGTMPLAFFSDHAIAAEAWARCIDVNIKGVLNGIMAAWDPMIRQGRGHIVNLSSIYGNAPVAGAAVYGASKAAVNFLTDALRQESQGRIKVTTVRPTGVPATALGQHVVNPEAVVGILGANAPAYFATLEQVLGENPPEALASPDSIEYACLSPELLADQIVYAIDQPWGVSISDLTVRASGDAYLL